MVLRRQPLSKVHRPARVWFAERLAKSLIPAGTEFGWLRVIARVSQPGERITRYQVQCRCGTIKIVYRHKLVSGETQSCGCQRKTWCRTPKPNPRLRRLPGDKRVRRPRLRCPHCLLWGKLKPIAARVPGTDTFTLQGYRCSKCNLVTEFDTSLEPAL